MKKKTWYLYVIRTEDDYLYTGITTDIKRRLSEHCNSKKGARFFRAHKPAEIVFKKKIGSQSDALKAEYAFKRLSKKKKLAAINPNKRAAHQAPLQS
ncbi:MAG: GIY-YIG nuclease family protein [Fibrobacteres bacterium]|nr:GIY-YIG nuclease family protein [Fibrobacterota bacterium]